MGSADAAPDVRALRVLHIGKFFPPHRGGMETFLADVIDEQRAQGMDAAAVVHGDSFPADPPWLTRVPVQAHLVYAPLAVGFRRAIARALRTFRPDVLHLHMPNNAVFWLLTLRGARQIPWVVHWHSDVVASRLRPLLRWAYALYRPFEQAVLARAERIVATSPAYLKASEPLEPWLDKCGVVPLGLQTLPSGPPIADGDVAAAPNAWRTPGDAGHTSPPLRLLSIGRLAYYKGFETLIDAVAKLDGVELIIAGDGELLGELQRQVTRLAPPGCRSRIRLLGPVSDAAKADLLRGCDVFCLASRERTEAFGMVLLEAMAYRKPCIVSDLAGSGMPWVVTEAACGICVQTEDVAAWCAAIRRLQAEPALRQQFGAAGARAVRQRFSIAHCATALSAEYGRAGCDLGLAGQASAEVLVVIPARNEGTTVGTLVATIIAAGWPNVLVVDDQSTDATAEAARAAGARVLQPVLPVGAWGGMQAGIRHAIARGYGCVITMDADGQHEVGQLPVLMAQRQHADLVIGAFPQRASRARQWAWIYFRRLAGFHLEDLTSGFRLYNRNAMAVLASDEASLLDYQDLGALLLARRAGLRIVEVPVTMNVRVVGRSKIFDSWFSVARYMAVTSLLCMSRWRVRRRGSGRSA